MASDTRISTSVPNTLTMAELCQAIQDGQITFTVRSGHYRVKGSDVRRLARERLGEQMSDIPLDVLVSDAFAASDVGCTA